MTGDPFRITWQMRLRSRLTVGRWGRITWTIWWLTGFNAGYHSGGDILFPYCVQCGERNRVEINDRLFGFTPWMHEPGCWVARRQRVELRYVRRYGKRAARRRDLAVASVY